MAEIFSNYFMLRVQCCAHNNRRMAHSISSFGPVATEMLTGEQHQFWTWRVRFWLLSSLSSYLSLALDPAVQLLESARSFRFVFIPFKLYLALSRSLTRVTIPFRFSTLCNAILLFGSFSSLARNSATRASFCWGAQHFLYFVTVSNSRFYIITLLLGSPLFIFFCDTRKRQKH